PRKGDTISGVEVVSLRSSVDMHLWVDGSSGFMGNGDKKPADKSARAPADESRPPDGDKAQVVIQTQGPFTYFVPRDLARFDSPPVNPNAELQLEDRVQVTREHVRAVTPVGAAFTVGQAGLPPMLGPLAGVAHLLGSRGLADRLHDPLTAFKMYDTLTC